MGAKDLKKYLVRVDGFIVGQLTKSKYKKLTGKLGKQSINTTGDLKSIIESVNAYDSVVLSQLAVSSTGSDMNDRILKVYAKTRRQSEHVARKYLGKVRRARARLKNG